jgi:hypothetical protein
MVLQFFTHPSTSHRYLSELSPNEQQEVKASRQIYQNVPEYPPALLGG